jgi:hypothetical protein
MEFSSPPNENFSCPYIRRILSAAEKFLCRRTATNVTCKRPSDFAKRLILRGLRAWHADCKRARSNMRALLHPILRRLFARERAAPLSRSAVRLALRIARYGEKVVLVDTGTNIRIERPSASRRADLQVLASHAGGALVIARRR